MNCPVDRILMKLSGAVQMGDGWSTHCPAHADQNPSLSVSAGDDGRALEHCHRGCSTNAIVSAPGLKLSDPGLVATCNAGGAGKWKREYAEHLKGRDVLILPDRNEPGDKHAEQVAKALEGVARRTQITTIPNVPEKGDLSAWLGPFRDAEIVSRLIVRRIKAKAAAATRAVPTFRMIPATDLIRSYPTLKQPAIDGLLRRGEVMNTIAPPKVGQSWLAHSLALSVTNGAKWLAHVSVTQERVLIIDNELHRETLSDRLAPVEPSRIVSRTVRKT